MDTATVARCRDLAGDIADDVQRYIDAHTTVGVERTILRAYGADGVDDQGAPLVNTAVERYREAGLIGRGIALPLGARPPRRRPQPAGGRRAPRLRAGDRPARRRPGTRARHARCSSHTRPRPSLASTAPASNAWRSGPVSPPAPTPLKYVIVATGNIHDDAVQAKAAASAGADIVAVIRATAQSLLDYVPHGRHDRGVRRHLRHPGELQDHPARARRRVRASTAGTSSRPTTRRASAWRRSPGWPRSSGSTCCSTTRCTASSFATSTCAARSSTSTCRGGSSRAPASSSTPARTTT